MINNTPALKKSLEITDQSVCVTEEESVCGEKSSFCFRFPQGNFKEQCRKYDWKKVREMPISHRVVRTLECVCC